MEAAFTNTIGSGLLGLLALVATAGMTAVVTYLSYWWALHYGLISFNEHGKLTLKPKNLPPGSMGLPKIGQTFVWMKNRDKFYDSHWRRHGEIYKTHLFGEPMVVVTTQEAAKNLLISNADSLKGDAPGNLTKLLGPHSLLFEEGEMHTRLRKRFMKHLQPEGLKSLLPAIEKLALKQLSGWSNGSTITFANEIERYTPDIMNVLAKGRPLQLSPADSVDFFPLIGNTLLYVRRIQYTFGVGILVCFGPLPALSAAKLNQELVELEKGFGAAPINKPGHQFYDSMQARNKFTKEVQDIINTRQTDQNSEGPKGILDSLADKEDALPQNVIDDNMLLLLYASVHSTASLMAFTLKFLHDHPKGLQKVKDEQEMIQNRKGLDNSLSWEDLKDMRYTYQVLLETGRFCNPIAWQYRLVTKELKYKGYVIPKNWGLLTLHQQWHQNPEVFPDPHKFDPSRFETPKLALTIFGMGNHFCAGYELARVEPLIFLHHFTTKFRWEITKDGPTQENLFPKPYADLPLKLTQL